MDWTAFRSHLVSSRGLALLMRAIARRLRSARRRAVYAA